MVQGETLICLGLKKSHGKQTSFRKKKKFNLQLYLAREVNQKYSLEFLYSMVYTQTDSDLTNHKCRSFTDTDKVVHKNIHLLLAYLSSDVLCYSDSNFVSF